MTALPLYTSAVEGSRSTKRKKKSDAQKTMKAKTLAYKADCKKLEEAIAKKDMKKTQSLIASMREDLSVYRQIAQIDSEDGGVIRLPEDDEYEGAGHAGAPLGYVVPVMRGGGLKKSDVRARAARSSSFHPSPVPRAHDLSPCIARVSRPQYALR